MGNCCSPSSKGNTLPRTPSPMRRHPSAGSLYQPTRNLSSKAFNNSNNNNSPSQQQQQQQQQSNNNNTNESQSNDKVVKLMLFGTGESGKTTILRQMGVISGGTSKQEISSQRTLLRGHMLLNVLEGAFNVIMAAESQFNLDFEGDDAESVKVIKEEMIKTRKNAFKFKFYSFNKKTAQSIINIYKNKNFQRSLDKRSDYEFPDGWFYYFNKLSANPGYPLFGGSEWIPSHEDLLRARIRTTGKQEVSFVQDNMSYTLIDTGGQIKERTKMIFLLQTVDAVIFVASMADYDQVLFEHSIENRLSEALALWEDVANRESLKDTFLLLLLNKKDLLQHKFKQRGIKIDASKIEAHKEPPLPSEDDEECTKTQQWFEDLYMSKVNEEKRRTVRTYFTNALDIHHIEQIFAYLSTFLKQSFVNN